MQLTIHTERGTFTSKRHEKVTDDQAKCMKDLLQKCAADGNNFTLETDSGYVVLGKELLRTAAFVVEE